MRHRCGNFTAILLLLTALHLARIGEALSIQPDCRDLNENCRHWVASDRDQCLIADFIKQNCQRSCSICMTLPPEYDVQRLPSRLKPIEWLVGIWRSENGGKAVFPTIPRFTYGEQVEISIAHPKADSAIPSLNYTTFAWAMNMARNELHSESGFITVNNDMVALTTVMSNGFVTVEEGPLSKKRIQFRLADVARISFSRDLPVHELIRDWSLLDQSTLEARLQMGTVTHGLHEHTSIVYTKIFP